MKQKMILKKKKKQEIQFKNQKDQYKKYIKIKKSKIIKLKLKIIINRFVNYLKINIKFQNESSKRMVGLLKDLFLKCK